LKVLYIFNGMVKNSGVLSISGGDMRLLEIIKNAHQVDPYVLTTSNGQEFLKKYDQKVKKSYIIDHDLTSGLVDNLKISFKSFFFGKSGVQEFRHETVYSSCEHLYDVLPALRLKLFGKNKWYAVYHWVEDYPWREKRGNTPFLQRYAYWLNRAFAGLLIKLFADNILAVSDQTKHKLIDIKHIKSARVTAVYCGVEFSRINDITVKYKNERASKYDAVFMKRLNYGKGVLDLLQIWESVVKLKPTAKLAIIGDGSDEVTKQVKNYITEHKLKNNIDLLGVIYDFDRKFRIINSSRIFLLPTHEENWAIVIGEAMACKVPVVVSRLKEIEPIWKDNVAWCDVGNIEQFSASTVGLLESQQKRDWLVDKANKFVKQYEWSKIAQKEFS
jgi:glycosyltransferase involved in cell wall biosynthesis